jgi:antitoxin YokJ
MTARSRRPGVAQTVKWSQGDGARPAGRPGTVLTVDSASRHSDELLSALTEVAQHPGCQLLPPTGPVTLPDRFTLPDDLLRFYELCGGAVLFEGATVEWTVSGPHQLVPASPRLLGPEPAHDIAAEYPDDLTNWCFVFAQTGPRSTDSLVVVDLHPARAGRYYDAFWDSYGLVGQMPILALTTAELLHRLLDTQGARATHQEPFHGDAYDDVDPLG